MSGFKPIAGRHQQHASIASMIGWGIAERHISPVRFCNDFRGPVLKMQLLELCARIGFTPPASSKVNNAFPSFDVLEVFPCRNNSPS